jgi:exonuclease SbcC
MKLQKLVINGFGPYALKQELDFETNLKDKNMFVITGNTGAGKTTIFDAINFALYGEPSGSDRDGKSLRSDFADPDTPTEVELWFSLRGKDYYVKRTPTYLKPKQRGEGYTESKATAEIKISKDKTITGAKEVTKEVENILGITTEQFKQLVMIPQGEFKKLLNAKSEEKEDIFRKIFGTEVFESIQKHIKEEANKLKKAVEVVERDRLNKIKSFMCKEEDEELYRLINASDPNIDKLMISFEESIQREIKDQQALEEKIQQVNEVIKKIQSEIALGEATNRKFSILEKNKEELEKLNLQVEEYKKKRLQLDRGRKAITVRAFEEKYNDKNREFKALDSKLIEIEKDLVIYKENYEKSKIEFIKQQNREEEKNGLIKDRDEKARLKEKISEYEENSKKVNVLQEKVMGLKGRIEIIQSNTLKNDETLQFIDRELQHINSAKEEKGKLEIQQIDCNNKKRKILDLTTSINQWIKDKKKHSEATVVFYEVDKEFLLAKTTCEELEDTFRRSQAGILALGLENGSPCPVCGSSHHPKVAQLENNEVTEESVKNRKAALEILREKRDNTLQGLTEINTSIKSMKENSINPLLKEVLNKEDFHSVKEVAIEVEGVSKENEALLVEINNNIEKLKNIIHNEEKLLQEKSKLQKNNEELRRELQLKNSELVVEEGNLRAANNTLSMIKSEFKGEIKTSKDLEEIIRVLSDKLNTLKLDFEQADRNFNTSKTLLDQEEGKQKTTKIMREKAEVELKEAVDIFKEKVLALSFENYTDYKSAVLSEATIELLDKEINDFNSRLVGAQKLYEASLKEIEGISLVDLTVFEEKLRVENEVKTNLDNGSKEIFARIKNNQGVLDVCKKFNKDIDEEEKKYKVVGKLSNVVNGDNTKKISFERYVLASYFEDIIQAANLRFNKITAGRFELLRKEDMGDKRKGQGLDLEVFDNYTGKARDVKTLSGGESFKASLSMALGLADVVQAYAGGIQLDTMFIDEGFGTLDPESLDNAIECLMDLQNDGRLVGIISHVAELKERITTRLEVRATNKGSKAEFIS